jgi:hypothetical protein
VKVTVTIRANDPEILPHELDGFVPFADCPLAVIRAQRYLDGSWQTQDGWSITHRPTGFKIGQRTWRTRKEAMLVLLACNPKFPAWSLAKGSKDDPATVACSTFFRAAMNASGS